MLDSATASSKVGNLPQQSRWNLPPMPSSLQLLESPASTQPLPPSPRRCSRARTANLYSQSEDIVPTGICLKHLEALVDAHYGWFREPSMRRGSSCKDTTASARKTMYDVCPELIITKTTCDERIVTVSADDVAAIAEGRIFANVEGTLIGLGEVSLDGQEIEGMAVEGKLCSTGQLRRAYWSERGSRDAIWMTSESHGRSSVPVAQAAHIPASLADEPELGEEWLCELEKISVGDTLVLRKGVAYADLYEPRQYPTTFASHWWGEETLNLVSSLRKHAEYVANIGDGCCDPGEVCYYICTLSNCQHRVSLGDTWEASPFHRALQHIAESYRVSKQPVHCMVMLFDNDCTPLRRGWCIFELWLCAKLGMTVHLYSGEGAITRTSTSPLAGKLREQVADIDLDKAMCSNTNDLLMIQKVIESADGGYAAVYAKLRLIVLDLLSFIGTMAASKDPLTGAKLNEVQLDMLVSETEKMQSSALVSRMVSAATSQETAYKRVLLVGPAGSGKTCFSRELTRVGIGFATSEGATAPLPVRVPLAELAKVAARSGKVEDLLMTWAREAFGEDAENIFAGVLRRPFLLILDGFDEAAIYRPQIMAWLRHWLNSEQQIMSTILLTTRPTGVTESSWPSSVSVHPPQKTKVHYTSASSLYVKEPLESDALVFVSAANGVARVTQCTEVFCLAYNVKAFTQEVMAGSPIYIRKGGSKSWEDWEVLKPLSEKQDEPHLLQPNANQQILVLIANAYNPPLSVNSELLVGSPDEYGENEQVNLKKEHQLFALEFRQETGRVDCQSVKRGAVVQELTCEQQLILEFGFTKASVMELSEESACSIAGLDMELISGIPMAVRSTPLLSTLLGQYVRTAGHDALSSRSFPWFEVDVVSSIVDTLLNEAEARLGINDFRKLFRAPCLQQLRDGKRLFDEQDLVKFLEQKGALLFEEARLGHLRFFEPIRGGQEIQAYHLRLHELLAAEAWSQELAKSGESLETALLQAMSNSQLLGAWRYVLMIHLKSRQQYKLDLLFPGDLGNEDSLSALATCLSSGLKQINLTFKCSSKLTDGALRSLCRSLPGSLEQLSIGFEDCNLAAEALVALAEALPKTLQEFNLGFTSCHEVVDDSIGAFARALPNSLRQVNLNFEDCAQLTDGTVDVVAQNLPSCVTQLELDFTDSDSFGAGDTSPTAHGLLAGAFGVATRLRQESGSLRLMSLADSSKSPGAGGRGGGYSADDPGSSLQCVHLKFVWCDNHTSAALVALARSIPSNLQRFSMNCWGCHRLSASAFVAVLSALPSTLQQVSLNFPNCLRLMDDALIALARSIPRDVWQVSVNCLACHELTSAGLHALACGLPDNLQQLNLDFGGCSKVENKALVSLGRGLPRSVKDVSLDFKECSALSDAGIISLVQSLPGGLEHISLNFARCHKLTDVGVAALAKSLPSSLQSVYLHFSSCHKLTDVSISTLAENFPSSLQHIHLGCSNCHKMTDTALIAVAQGFPSGLLQASLAFARCNELTDQGLRALDEACLPNLQQTNFNFGGCQKLSDAMLVKLARQPQPQTSES
eukprot:TRINITY_DN5165_c0_g2_i1.p1 TRINITY_DN5165_c0_g2~~TRINITY_DN5165_c0_g2_i1.p1  ORF type:complete len:1550 (+),score=290.72 TRINITY_DN5165_c0_g2_i1:1-4650(+)